MWRGTFSKTQETDTNPTQGRENYSQLRMGELGNQT